jgi:hypothetical protein
VSIVQLSHRRRTPLGKERQCQCQCQCGGGLSGTILRGDIVVGSRLLAKEAPAW